MLPNLSSLTNIYAINPAIARKISREILEEKYQMAHQLWKRGMTKAEIDEIVEVHADTVGRVIFKQN